MVSKILLSRWYIKEKPHESVIQGPEIRLSGFYLPESHDTAGGVAFWQIEPTKSDLKDLVSPTSVVFLLSYIPKHAILEKKTQKMSFPQAVPGADHRLSNSQ